MIEMNMQGDILLVKIKEFPSNLDKVYLDFTIQGELDGKNEKPVHASIFKCNNEVFIESNMLTIIVNEEKNTPIVNP